MNLNLKGRLKLIADKVPACNTAADIGTDHAYLPIYLIQQQICNKAIASDVKIGPVKAAARNISLYNLNDKIETRLGNGLDTIDKNEADVIIIAGMGGTLLTGLLNADVEKAEKASALILQPMNDLDVARKWLYDHKFDITDEEMAAEGTKYYCVITAQYDGKDKVYEDFQLHVGEKLIKRNDPLLLPYSEMKVRQIERVLNQLKAMENNEELLTYYTLLKRDYLSLINNIKRKSL